MSRRRSAIVGFWTVFALPLAWTIVFLIVPYAVMIAISFWKRKFPVFVPDFSSATISRCSPTRNTRRCSSAR